MNSSEKVIHYIPSCDFNQRKLNAVLMEYFVSLSDNIEYGKYRKAKGLDYDVLRESYNNLLRIEGEVEYIFFGNLLEDFDPKMLRVFPDKKFCGIIHDTYSDGDAYGADAKNLAYEDFVLSVCEFAVTASDYIRKKIIARRPDVVDKLYPGFVPNIEYNPTTRINVSPDDKHHILWNHRPAKVKNPYEFLKLCKEVIVEDDRKDIVFHVPCAAWTPQILKDFNDFRDLYPDNFKIYIRLPQEDYNAVIRQCKIGISTSFHEGFPGAVIEAINENVLYIAPNDLMFPEFIPNDLLYERGNIDSLKQRIYLLLDSEYLYARILDKSKSMIRGYGIKGFMLMISKIVGGELAPSDVDEGDEWEDDMEELF